MEIEIKYIHMKKMDLIIFPLEMILKLFKNKEDNF
jgi:hypothetical protein